MAQQIKTKFIEDLAITTAKIAAGAVTGAKIETSVALAGSPTTTTQSYGANNTTIATTAFVQAALSALESGLKPKQAVRVASSVNVAIATGLENGDTVDGITLATGDRVLLIGQTLPEQNGIYVVVSSGAASRATDFDALTPVDEINRAWVPVQAGTHAGKIYVQYGTVATVGTDPITFTFYDPIASLVGGDMVSVSGSTIAVDLATVSGLESSNPGNSGGQLRIKLEASNPTLLITGSNELGIKLNGSGAITGGASGIGVAVDGSTIEINTNALRVKDAGITAAKLASDVTLQEIVDRGNAILVEVATTKGIDIEMGPSADSHGVYVLNNGTGAGVAIETTNGTGLDIVHGGAATAAAINITNNAAAQAIAISQVGNASAIFAMALGTAPVAQFIGGSGDSALIVLAGAASDQYAIDVTGEGQAAGTKAAMRVSNGVGGAIIELTDSTAVVKLKVQGSSSWSLTLPANDGDAGQALVTNGSGVTSWSSVTPNVAKEQITLTGTDITNGYVDLAVEALADSIVGFVGRLAIHKTEDYTTSVVSTKTRITFTGSLVTGQPEALVAGDVLFFTYLY